MSNEGTPWWPNASDKPKPMLQHSLFARPVESLQALIDLAIQSKPRLLDVVVDGRVSTLSYSYAHMYMVAVPWVVDVGTNYYQMTHEMMNDLIERGLVLAPDMSGFEVQYTPCN